MILFSLLMTTSLYVIAKHCYKKKPKIYLSPLITVPLLISLVLLFSHISYETYNEGAKWLSLMLQPATIAFAVPLYRYRAILQKHAYEIIFSVLLGSIVAICSSALIAEMLHIDPQVAGSLIPRSVTTPIAMDISQISGGIPSITAVFVIMTGLLGSLLGPFVIQFFKIKSEVARGILFGTSAHAVGTSKAFEFSTTTGTVSSLSMIIAAIISVCAMPLLMPLLHNWI